jgi:plastocyanin
MIAMHLRFPVALAASIAASLAASTPAAAAPQTHVVVIDKMKFGALPANVRRGDVIRWVNKDLFRHTATALNRSFHVDLPPGAQGTTVVRNTGTIPFLCKYHPGMRGVLRVAR